MITKRWWYSEEQKKVMMQLSHRFHSRKVLVNNEWCEYTECTNYPNMESLYEDAVLIAESTGELPTMINGVKQTMRVRK